MGLTKAESGRRRLVAVIEHGDERAKQISKCGVDRKRTLLEAVAIAAMGQRYGTERAWLGRVLASSREGRMAGALRDMAAVLAARMDQATGD